MHSSFGLYLCPLCCVMLHFLRAYIYLSKVFPLLCGIYWLSTCSVSPPLWIFFLLVHLLMCIKSPVFYLLYRSEIARSDLRGSHRSLGSWGMNKLTMWLSQLPGCLSLCTVEFLWLTYTPFSIENLRSSAAPSGRMWVRQSVTVDILIGLRSRPPDHCLWAAGFRGAMSA